MKKADMWKPVINIHAAIARVLIMDDEATKTVIARTTLFLVIVARLRHQARIRSTHYSTPPLFFLPFFTEDQFDGDFVEAEFLADGIHQIALIGKVDAFGVGDKCLMVPA